MEEIQIHSNPSIEALKHLFETWSNEPLTSLEQLAISGSNRAYYRMTGTTKSCIGTYCPDKKESAAFISFSKHFKSKNLPVPEVYSIDDEHDVYLQEDFGDEALYKLLPAEGEQFSEEFKTAYKKSLEALAKMQIVGRVGIDWTVCYPRAAFDAQSMLWDLHYFKNYFLKLSKVPFDEQLLEDDFNTLIEFLLEAEDNYFLFRDFQSRNIILSEGEPHFIDYQGGRKGALQYDVASLLFQAKANIPHSIREELIQHYLDAAEKLMPIDRQLFLKYFYGFVLIRCLQAMGTYGFRGLYERKEHFLQSIPASIKNIQWLLDNVELPIHIPELHQCLLGICSSEEFRPFDKTIGANSSLKVEILSFSFKKGLPQDNTEHGGGFIFDCRAIDNPGRYPAYKSLTGKDERVITFLRNRTQVEFFLMHVQLLVDMSVEKYIKRNFDYLSISFGCTGGQHRSVYCAEMLFKHIRQKYGVKVNIVHREQENWPHSPNLSFKGK